MIKVQLLTVGKTKESWLKEALAEYEKRLTGKIQLEYHLFKSDEELFDQIEPSTILLDPEGEEMTSHEFAAFLVKAGSRLSLAIGGALGFTPEVKKGKRLLSLSKMTFTHQLARLLLVEQLYRAHSLIEGGPYHK